MFTMFQIIKPNFLVLQSTPPNSQEYFITPLNKLSLNPHPNEVQFIHEPLLGLS